MGERFTVASEKGRKSKDKKLEEQKEKKVTFKEPAVITESTDEYSRKLEQSLLEITRITNQFMNLVKNGPNVTDNELEKLMFMFNTALGAITTAKEIFIQLGDETIQYQKSIATDVRIALRRLLKEIAKHESLGQEYRRLSENKFVSILLQSNSFPRTLLMMKRHFPNRSPAQPSHEGSGVMRRKIGLIVSSSVLTSADQKDIAIGKEYEEKFIEKLLPHLENLSEFRASLRKRSILAEATQNQDRLFSSALSSLIQIREILFNTQKISPEEYLMFLQREEHIYILKRVCLEINQINHQLATNENLKERYGIFLNDPFAEICFANFKRGKGVEEMFQIIAMQDLSWKGY